MSPRKMGVRAALATAGVLVWVALMAAPSWAAGGNSARALCNSYPGVLFAQDGSDFKNVGLCTASGARGQLAGVTGVAEPLPGGDFLLTWSGFGMEPGSGAFGGARYSSGVSVGDFGVVASDGTFFIQRGPPRALSCTNQFGTVGTLVVQATTAAGTGFIRDIPFPPGVC